ncbi:MAG: hypothetical protein LQ345_000689 [Seirophora villosa]|nr:MAG: hypothetical protein LQ345_000689 [Seirophora villosa]
MTIPNPPAQTKSTHLPSSPLLPPFLSSSTSEFSPSAYLNTHLPAPPPPPHQTLAPQTHQPQTHQTPLTILTAQTQSHISALSALTSSLSDTLSRLAAGIQRAGPRLGYGVEVLREEVEGLVGGAGLPLFPVDNIHTSGETSEDYENKDISKAFQDGKKTGGGGEEGEGGGGVITVITSAKDTMTMEMDGGIDTKNTNTNTKHMEVEEEEEDDITQTIITRLRTLLRVRDRLRQTTRIFALALEWRVPPSLLLLPSRHPASSTSTPPPQRREAEAEDEDEEQKGQASLSRLRAEVLALAQEEDEEARAREKVAGYKECVGVWKGTSEEAGRRRWVEGLEGEVEMMVGEMARRRRRRGGGE